LLPAHAAYVLALMVMKVPGIEEPVASPTPDLRVFIGHEMHQPVGLGLIAMMRGNHHPPEFVNEEFGRLLVNRYAWFLPVPFGKGEHDGEIDGAVVVAGKNADSHILVLR